MAKGPKHLDEIQPGAIAALVAANIAWLRQALSLMERIDDETFAVELARAGLAVADPVWRLPFWTSYEAGLESSVADLNNVSDGPFAGAVTAALFLRKFVKNAGQFAHLDIYGWRQVVKPLGPKGGEVNAARALFHLLATRHGPPHVSAKV